MLNDALLGELARQYGTPSYIFDESALEERIAAVREIFGADIRLCYSIKANPFLIPAALENWTDWKSAPRRTGYLQGAGRTRRGYRIFRCI